MTVSGQYKSSGAREKPHITRGHDKDGRPKLKQLVFGLNVTSDGAVPLLRCTPRDTRQRFSLHERWHGSAPPVGGGIESSGDAIAVAAGESLSTARLSGIVGLCQIGSGRSPGLT